jgi:hypothetical protein
VPPPIPAYLPVSTRDTTYKSLLFNILSLTSNSTPFISSRTADVIAPSGYSADPHDSETAFFVGAFLIALGKAGALPMEDAVRLAETYAQAHVEAGRWEHAALILLCAETLVAPGDKAACSAFCAAKAKDLVLRNAYDGSRTPDAPLLRSFGVPRAWLDEARALRAGRSGDLVGHIKVSDSTASGATSFSCVPTTREWDTNNLVLCAHFARAARHQPSSLVLASPPPPPPLTSSRPPPN